MNWVLFWSLSNHQINPLEFYFTHQILNLQEINTKNLHSAIFKPLSCLSLTRFFYRLLKTDRNMGYFRPLIWPYTCLHFFIDSIIKMRYFLLRGAEFSAFFTSPYLQQTKMKNYLFEMINKFQTSRNTVWYVCSWRTHKLRSFK